MIDFMFDTNIFDYMIDKQINPAEATRKGTIWVANVQFSEIENVPDLQRRQQLQNMLNLVRHKNSCSNQAFGVTNYSGTMNSLGMITAQLPLEMCLEGQKRLWTHLSLTLRNVITLRLYLTTYISENVLPEPV